jgi:hypothetical protein
VDNLVREWRAHTGTTKQTQSSDRSNRDQAKIDQAKVYSVVVKNCSLLKEPPRLAEQKNTTRVLASAEPLSETLTSSAKQPGSVDVTSNKEIGDR